MILKIIGPTETNSFPARWEVCSFEGFSFFQTINLSLHSGKPYIAIGAGYSILVCIRRFREVGCPGTKERERGGEKAFGFQ
jgi:hypothetical protein